VSFTRLALVLGGLVLAGLCVLAGIGFAPAIAVLVTVALLVLFVAAGNLVSGRPGKPRFARPLDETGAAPGEASPEGTP
jgi:hypothetical protein